MRVGALGGAGGAVSGRLGWHHHRRCFVVVVLLLCCCLMCWVVTAESQKQQNSAVLASKDGTRQQVQHVTHHTAYCVLTHSYVGKLSGEGGGGWF